jgi:hypothetical protein
LTSPTEVAALKASERHNDQLDALSLAFAKLSGPGPIRISQEALRRCAAKPPVGVFL